MQSEPRFTSHLACLPRLCAAARPTLLPIRISDFLPVAFPADHLQPPLFSLPELYRFGARPAVPLPPSRAPSLAQLPTPPRPLGGSVAFFRNDTSRRAVIFFSLPLDRYLLLPFSPLCARNCALTVSLLVPLSLFPAISPFFFRCGDSLSRSFLFLSYGEEGAEGCLIDASANKGARRCPLTAPSSTHAIAARDA